MSCSERNSSALNYTFRHPRVHGLNSDAAVHVEVSFRCFKISQRLFPVLIVYDIVVIALEIHGITLAGDNVLDNPLKIPPPS